MPSFPRATAAASAAAAVAALDARRLLLSRRVAPLLVLGGVPVVLSAFIAALAPSRMPLGRFVEEFALIYQVLILSGTLFFGVANTFVGLLRGEMIEKSLHYVLLSPVRREAVAAGKYAAGLIATGLAFGISTALSYGILMCGAGEAGRERLLSPAGLGALSTYALTSVLACAAYGGLFLTLGLLGKNPMVGAALFWGLDRISVVFPPVIKRLFPSYHLDSLLPVHPTQGPFALLVDPAPWWVAVPALLVFGAVFAVVASLGARRIEVRYGAE